MFTDDGDTFICFINIGEGTSVTNASEQLATEIVNNFLLNPGDCRFFETYQEYNYESFDEIEYTWVEKGSHWEASGPQWRPGDENYKPLFTNE